MSILKPCLSPWSVLKRPWNRPCRWIWEKYCPAKGLVVTAVKQDSAAQIGRISYPSGNCRAATDDAGGGTSNSRADCLSAVFTACVGVSNAAESRVGNRPAWQAVDTVQTGTALGEGHDRGGTNSRGDAGADRFGGSRRIGAVRIVRGQQCSSSTAMPLRDVLGRVHGHVRACRPDCLREPPEPHCRASWTNRRWGRGGSGGSRPRGSRPGRPRASRTGSPIAWFVCRKQNARLPSTVQRRVLWLRTAPEEVTAATRQDAAARSRGLRGGLGDMFCPHK